MAGHMDVAVAARAGRPAWVNRRTILGVILLSGSIFGGQAVMEAGRTTAPMWIAAEDLAGGSPITRGSLRMEEVRLPPTVASGYISSTQSLEGYVVTRPVAAGELVPRAWVVRASPGSGRSLTVPVDPEHAVGGALRPGDIVDIFATFDAGDARARTVLLVRKVEVFEVVAAGGLVMGEEAVVGITISVTPDEAQRVAFATRTAHLDVARVDDPSDGAARAVITGADF